MRRERSEDRHGQPHPETSLRLCAVDRVQRDPDELIRFVPGPDNVVVPDVARKLPGRGVWVTADRRHLAEAVRGKAFQRSLKRAVEVPPDLADIVERQLVRRAVDALALANKAGQVITGFEKIDKRLASGEIRALVHGRDASADGSDKLDRKMIGISGGGDAKSRILAVLTIEQMSLAMGRPNVVHAALIKGGATERFLTEAGRLVRFRSDAGLSETEISPATLSPATQGV
ncbi:MAG: RNA-binding protein [Hyphomicrobiaceae bacterium]|nr:RNA-binding protein [Hyphomicrobiaceae bacterium]